MAALLDAASRRLLDQLRLPVRPRSAGNEQGGHRSEVLASGLEFADHRMYVPGDDVRQIDWKAFARHRQLVVRTFEEDRDVRVSVLLDVSASMARGTPPKLEVARSLASAFAYLAMKQLDRVRVIPFSSDLSTAAEGARSRADYPRVERYLSGLEAEGLTSFSKTVRSFVERYPARGLVVVLSDLMEATDWSDGLRLLARQGQELWLVRVACAEDDDPRLRGELELFDVETGEMVRVAVTPSLIEAYKRELAAHVERCRSACVRVSGRFVEARVETPVEQILRAVLAPAVMAA